MFGWCLWSKTSFRRRNFWNFFCPDTNGGGCHAPHKKSQNGFFLENLTINGKTVWSTWRSVFHCLITYSKFIGIQSKLQPQQPFIVLSHFSTVWGSKSRFTSISCVQVGQDPTWWAQTHVLTRAYDPQPKKKFRGSNAVSWFANWLRLSHLSKPGKPRKVENQASRETKKAGKPRKPGHNRGITGA